MEFNYNLDENDFLEYQLYSASKSKNIRVQRRKSLIIVIAIFFLLFVFLYTSTKQFPILPLVGYIILIVIYKFYESYRYKNHYKKYIKENYKDRIGLNSKINFEYDQITDESKLGESKIKYASIKEINEIKNYYFLKLITGQSLIIPKKEITNPVEFKSKMNHIISKYGIIENSDLNWKWR